MGYLVVRDDATGIGIGKAKRRTLID